MPANSTGRNEGALAYNPRCLTRDINLEWSRQTRQSDVEYLLRCPDVLCLEQRADGWEQNNSTSNNGRYVRRGTPQVHPAGHFAVGGLQNDPFASPGDPVFYLHHAQFDRVWAIWQGLDPAKRTYQVAGTKTPFNSMSLSSIPVFFISLGFLSALLSSLFVRPPLTSQSRFVISLLYFQYSNQRAMTSKAFSSILLIQNQS